MGGVISITHFPSFSRRLRHVNFTFTLGNIVDRQGVQ